MSYRVLWTPNAEVKFEQFLLQSPLDQKSLALAARELDRRLMQSPNDFGESRYENMRIGFVRPLGIQFEVMDDVRTAIVHDVWRIDRS